MSEVGNEWDDVLGVQLFENLSRHDGLSHSGGGDWADGVGEDILLLTLLGKGLGQSVDSELGGRVVSLSERSVDSGGGGGVDDSSEVLLSHDVPGGSGNGEGSLQVDLHDQVPNCSDIFWNETSLRIPALLITTSTLPKVSIAVLIILSPNSTES